MAIETINLSFFLTTFGKLPYLKICLQELIDSRQPDEEIVIVDGGSKDGTAEWLAAMHEEGKIQKFISLPDFGESHGTNRAMLLCEGRLLKILTDDDIYCLEAIRECKQFMLEHGQFDLLGADGFDNYANSNLSFVSNQPKFKNWLTNHEPFGFYGPGLMIRRSSLPLLGLFHTLVKFIDNEYTFRATSLPVKMAWYTRPMFVRVVNAQSNTLKFERIKEWEERINDLYGQLSRGMKAAERYRTRLLNRLKQRAYKMLHPAKMEKPDLTRPAEIEKIYKGFNESLQQQFNSSTAPYFLY